MNARPQRRLRRIFFALAPAVILLLAATLIVSLLERCGVIDTEVPDDRVAYLAGPAFVRDHPLGTYESRDGDMIKQRFPALKPMGAFRIFVLGGSFAQGQPYVMTGYDEFDRGGIDSWLREDLKARYPARNFEVINAAAAGQNSHRVLEIFREVCGYSPDLAIVIMGNNEGFNPPTPFNRYLHRWSLYRVMRKLLVPPIADGGQRPKYTQYDTQADLLAEAFSRNLDRIIEIAEEKDIDLLLTTVPVNIKYNPEAWSRGEPYDWTIPYGCFKLMFETIGLHKVMNITDVVYSCLDADAYYQLALDLEQQGRYEQALNAYLFSCELSPKNRIRPSLNAIIRQRAQRHSVIFVDLERTAQDISEHGIPGCDLFHDMCHMRWQGYAAMAKALADEIVARGIAGNGAEARPYCGVDTLRSRIGLDEKYLDLARTKGRLTEFMECEKYAEAQQGNDR